MKCGVVSLLGVSERGLGCSAVSAGRALLLCISSAAEALQCSVLHLACVSEYAPTARPFSSLIAGFSLLFSNHNVVFGFMLAVDFTSSNCGLLV